MSSVAIYMEGGGDSRDGKAALRQGMDEFLAAAKGAARIRSWRWKLVCCGGRGTTFAAFRRAMLNREATVVVLLVDAEEAVTTSPATHLCRRDGWDLAGIPETALHLMTPVMETWIVADSAALQTYFGQRFNPNPLPKSADLEPVGKAAIAKALHDSTRQTQKGAYHKLHHAPDLLARISPLIVRQRCPSCCRLLEHLDAQLAA